ncbi:unnamed protein product [Vitrella brassicaformis CCMP3155]|uniref:Uncharacterized protein n=1 Tax=Vitrella brassicaformis (strain CCMP3155) TaxID=1169540 RepID=A0A0G4EEC1_VITBC|nr:unnamed protein product [Vitrella brassicaformis CCMP3155]|eukprot:CEL93905.1 unnamed protein product [Vitrella brassicaformis CCMP3155]
MPQPLEREKADHQAELNELSKRVADLEAELARTEAQLEAEKIKSDHKHKKGGVVRHDLFEVAKAKTHWATVQEYAAGCSCAVFPKAYAEVDSFGFKKDEHAKHWKNSETNTWFGSFFLALFGSFVTGTSNSLYVFCDRGAKALKDRLYTTGERLYIWLRRPFKYSKFFNLQLTVGLAGLWGSIKCAFAGGYAEFEMLSQALQDLTSEAYLKLKKKIKNHSE